MLTEDEKLTLGMILREKIVETHDVETVIKEQMSISKTKQSKSILEKALFNIRTLRDDCYSIALKLKIK